MPRAPKSVRPPSLVLLGAASGLSPLGVTIVVPLLASIAGRFEADFGQVQFLVSAYLLGLALAQPINGFLCDRFGRRPVMLAGFFLFVLVSSMAVFVQQLDTLIVLRFFQAVGVSVGTVASRAVVRDTRGAQGAAESLSYIAAAMGFAPILAPIIGGWLGAAGDYRAVFAVTAAVGAVLLLWSFVSFPETLDQAQARPRWRDSPRNYLKLLGSGSFMAYSMIFGFTQGSFFAFLAVGAALFRAEFGMSEAQFGLIWGLLAIAYVLSSIAGGRLNRRMHPARIVRFGIFCSLLGGWLMPVAAAGWGVSLAGILLPLVLLMAGAGLIMPGALAGAVNAHPEMAGTGAGLSSAVGILFGGSFTVIAGYLYTGDFLPIAGLVACAASLTAICWFGVCRYGVPITGPAPLSSGTGNN